MSIGKCGIDNPYQSNKGKYILKNIFKNLIKNNSTYCNIENDMVK